MLFNGVTTRKMIKAWANYIRCLELQLSFPHQRIRKSLLFTLTCLWGMPRMILLVVSGRPVSVPRRRAGSEAAAAAAWATPVEAPVASASPTATATATHVTPWVAPSPTPAVPVPSSEVAGRRVAVLPLWMHGLHLHPRSGGRWLLLLAVRLLLLLFLPPRPAPLLLLLFCARRRLLLGWCHLFLDQGLLRHGQ